MEPQFGFIVVVIFCFIIDVFAFIYLGLLLGLGLYYLCCKVSDKIKKMKEEHKHE